MLPEETKTLSDKIYSDIDMIDTKDVKQFIKEVKEETEKIRDNNVDVIQGEMYDLAIKDFKEIINKKAGERLI